MFFKKKDKKGIKDKKYRWQPVLCNVELILELFEQGMEAGGGPELTVLYNGIIAEMGLTYAYDGRVFYDPEFYIRNDSETSKQIYKTFEEFKENAVLNGVMFMEIKDKISILNDEVVGNPRGYTILKHL